MGYGEAGLRRALLWGRREVTGVFITPETARTMNPIDLQGIDLGRVSLSDYPSVKSSAIGTISQDVISAFSDLGYVVEKGDTKSMLIQYQLDHNIIANRDETGAGNFGPKTRASLVNEHSKFQSIHDVELKLIEENKKLLLSEHTLWEERTREVEVKISTIGSPAR